MLKSRKYYSKHPVLESLKNKLVEKQSRAMKSELKAAKSIDFFGGVNSLELADLHLD